MHVRQYFIKIPKNIVTGRVQWLLMCPWIICYDCTRYARITGYCSYMRKMLNKVRHGSYHENIPVYTVQRLTEGYMHIIRHFRDSGLWFTVTVNVYRIQKFSDTYDQGSLDLNYWCDIVQLNSCSRGPVVLAACLL